MSTSPYLIKLLIKDWLEICLAGTWWPGGKTNNGKDADFKLLSNGWLENCLHGSWWPGQDRILKPAKLQISLTYSLAIIILLSHSYLEICLDGSL